MILDELPQAPPNLQIRRLGHFFKIAKARFRQKRDSAEFGDFSISRL